MERVDLPRTAVERFSLPVVGGIFVVAEVLLAPGQNAGQIVDSIRSQPMERWLVMTALEHDLQADALALINDAYECQIVALGNLRAEGA